MHKVTSRPPSTTAPDSEGDFEIVLFAPKAVINDGGNLVIAIDWSARPLQGPNRGDPAALKLKVDDAALQG